MKRILLVVSLLSTCTFTNLSLGQNPTLWTGSFTPHFRHLNAIEILPNNRIVAIGGWEFNDAISTIITSDDTCSNWNIIWDNVNAILQDLDFTSSTNGYTVGWSGNIWKTTNSGDNWSQIIVPGNAGTRNYTGCHFFDDNTGVVVGGNKTLDSIQTIIRTTDGGANWDVISDNLGPWLRAVHFADANTGYTVGDHGTILKSNNGGVTWTVLTIPSNVETRRFNDVYFTDSNNGIAVGGKLTTDSISTILKTTDGGLNWTIVMDNLGSMLKGVHFYNTNEGYVVGDDGVIYHTNDAGSTWSFLTIPANNTYGLNAVYFKDAYFGIAVGSDGKALWYVEDNTGLAEISSNNAKLITNPAEGSIIIEFDQFPTETITVSILDLTGRIIQKDNFVQSGNQLNININNLPSQYCFVIVTEGMINHSFKTLVK